jgi:hypothetical protein
VPFDLRTFDLDVQARIKTASPAPRTVSTCDDFKDAINRAVNLPAAFTMYKGSKSAGRLVMGSRKQLRSPLKLFLAIVAESLLNQQQAHLAIYGILQPIENVLVGYTPPDCLSPLIFDGDYFVMRDGPKVVYGAEFRSKALDFTS